MWRILSLLFKDPLSNPLRPTHRHQLVVRDEMDREPIEDPNNWLPRKEVAQNISRPYLWKGLSR